MINDTIERLILKIRMRLDYDFTKEEIYQEFSKDFTSQEIFFAYKAAIILMQP